MRRRAFWLSLFSAAGLARAARKVDLPRKVGELCSWSSDESCAPRDPAWRAGRAADNQCPVCGAFALPWWPAARLAPCKPSAPGVDLSLCVSVDNASRIMRCHRCNAAFFQDAV